MPLSIEDYSPHDQQIWDEELQDFVPNRVFDAHIHLFNRKHLPAAAGAPLGHWGDADLATLRQWAQRLYPGRETHFLVLGTPVPGIDVAAFQHPGGASINWAAVAGHRLKHDSNRLMNDP